ncbi:proline dehydrogenase [Schizosaccharomyces cryophilus OY26]|uniref:Proline dehydrogenase n=1 Tax=Schizosaccharomyces cryophilus (strain OY26 / ATCC MYA-4695 / CBS 11777 / NBRC 106824 / NRRL Y48691) TaxID=653667 RepID=S9X8F4_SCHCR|nr:proline dehydrogenase [Schizosaccharomyces cryophilus OY26]EPY50111.1 proline dehydrogenase [Schizosaccharomyces cryophilus OY26]
MHFFRLRSGLLRNGKLLLGIGAGAAVSLNSMGLTNESEASFFQKGFSKELSHRSFGDVARGFFIYEICSRAWLVKTSIAAMSLCDTLHLSFLYAPFCRRTFYRHFCGGETPTALIQSMQSLQASGISPCLNSSREIDLPSDIDPRQFVSTANSVPEEIKAPNVTVQQKMHDIAQEAFDSYLLSIDLASKVENSSCAIKLTPFINPLVLFRFNAILNNTSNQPAASFSQILNGSPLLSPYEKEELQRFWSFSEKVCEFAQQKGVLLFMDAEQTYFQDTIHSISLDLMRKYNKQEAIVHNTYQLYLKKTRGILNEHMRHCALEDWLMGAKIVRGAYINSEPRHLIHDTKEDTDRDFNGAMDSLFLAASRAAPGTSVASQLPSKSRKGKWGIMVATHNKSSICKVLDLLERKKIDTSKTSLYLAQLLGMSDDITYALAAYPRSEVPEFHIAKYVSWGPIYHVLPYLVRRARENIDALGRSTEERAYYRQELRRRLHI